MSNFEYELLLPGGRPLQIELSATMSELPVIHQDSTLRQLGHDLVIGAQQASYDRALKSQTAAVERIPLTRSNAVRHRDR